MQNNKENNRLTQSLRHKKKKANLIGKLHMNKYMHKNIKWCIIKKHIDIFLLIGRPK